MRYPFTSSYPLLLGLQLVALILLQSLPTSRAFVVIKYRCPACHYHSLNNQGRPRQGVVSLASSPQPAQPRPIRPVFVDNEISFLGAASALFAFEVLTGKLTIPKDETAATGYPEVGQPVFMFSDHKNLLEQLHPYQSSEPILHATLRPGKPIPISQDILNRIWYVGLHLMSGTEGRVGIAVASDVARTQGMALQQILQWLPPSLTSTSPPIAWVSLDLALHAAMLQANCLPNQTPNLPHNDAYYVMLPNGDSIMIDYDFYTKNPGGNDPLLCPTKEVLVETSPTNPSSQRSTAQSAAYSALRGNGMDPLGSAAIAASVATILGDSDFATGPITWSDMERTVLLGRHIRQYGTSKNGPGLMRQKYIDCGYK